MLDDALIDGYLQLGGIDVAPSDIGSNRNAALDLEAQGWRPWLTELMPFAFEEEFSADHVKFWNLFWSVLFRIKRQREIHSLLPLAEDAQEAFYRQHDCWIEPKEYAILLILGRGLAKSSTIEAAVVMRGCILGGYAVYVCEAQDQADEHLGNIKALIAHDDSRVVEFYPHMSIDEDAMFKGKKIKNRTDLFITIGGFIGRSKGLNTSLRGIRVGNLRPDCICLDDVDGLHDSIAISIKKLGQIAQSIIPIQARRQTTILGGQNLIGENTVFSQIYTGKSDVLSERTVIGVTNTFVQFREHHEYITYMDEEEGRIKHKILPTAVSTWSGVRLSDAQKFLSDSGLAAFLSEYMNSFAHLKTGKVFEFDEARHLITWDRFEEVMGLRHIPGHWRAKAGADLGYSQKSVNAWLFVARSARNAKLPGLYFGYRSRTYPEDSIDDQAIDLWEDFFPNPEIGKKHFEATQRFADYPELFRVLSTRPRCQPYMKHFEYDPIRDQYRLKAVDPMTWKDAEGMGIDPEAKALFYVKQAANTFQSQIQSWAISHEKTGEQKTFAQKYGIPLMKVARHEADAGVVEANHLLRGDYTQPHPFYPDEIVPETGLYKLGRPYIYFIVRRIQSPEDDRDFKLFRQHVGNQRWTQEKINDQGLTKTIPLKFESDHCDAFRHFAVDYALPDSTPKTLIEEIQERIPEKHRPPEDRAMTPEEQMSYQAALQYAKEKTAIDLDLDPEEDFVDHDDDSDYY